jgi:hypothetical protein
MEEKNIKKLKKRTKKEKEKPIKNKFI